jgi:hypothetical protein
MENRYSLQSLIIQLLGLIFVLFGLFAGILSGCSSSKKSTRSEKIDTLKTKLSGLVLADQIKGKGLDIGEELSYQTPQFNYKLERISDKYYLEERTEREIHKKETQFVPTKIKDKSKTTVNINSGNKIDDHSKDKSKDKSKTNSENKDKSQVNSGNKTKDKSGFSFSWLLWILIAVLALRYLWKNKGRIMKIFTGV